MNVVLTHQDVSALCEALASKLKAFALQGSKIYPIPRGGIPVAYLLQRSLPSLVIVDSPEEANVFIDDLIDSGSTMQRYCDDYPGRPFFALIDKQQNGENRWIVFPWEVTSNHDASGEDIVVRLLQYIGENSEREGLRETPKRVLKAWKHWTSGYDKDASKILKVFEDGAENCDQMIVRKDIPIYSHCEHHLAAIIGKCTIAYIPNGKIVGLSKLDRLADMFARRLQVQERLTNQIADAIVENLDPVGVGVWISARHLCVESRGVASANSETITTALRGCIRDQDAARAEFLALARS